MTRQRIAAVVFAVISLAVSVLAVQDGEDPLEPEDEPGVPGARSGPGPDGLEPARGHGFRAFKTVTVTVRFENFITFARSRTGREAWTSEEALWTAALDLLLPFLDARENPRNRKLRLIGVRAEKLSR